MRPIVTAVLLLAIGGCDPVKEQVDPACSDYCAAHMDICSGEFAQYPSQEVCETVCREELALPVGDPLDSDGNPTESGNSVYCRLTHSDYATRNPPASQQTHCKHAGYHGGNVCGSWCENYCHGAVLNCSDYIFDGEMSGCLSECQVRLDNNNVRKDGKTGDVSGNTIHCRMTHLLLAGGEEGERESNCMAADLDNSAVCVGASPD